MGRRRKRYGRPRRPLEQAVKVVEGRVSYGFPEQWAQNSSGVWFSRYYSYTSPRMIGNTRISYGYCKTDGQWTRWESQVDWNGNVKSPPEDFRAVDLKVRVPKGATRDETW